MILQSGLEQKLNNWNLSLKFFSNSKLNTNVTKEASNNIPFRRKTEKCEPYLACCDVLINNC
jgi:hypothetical protein